MCGTTLVNDMGYILIPEMPERGVDRIGRSLPQGTERILLNRLTEFLKGIKVFHRTLSFGDLRKYLEYPLGTDTAGRTLSAGFITDEFHIELCHIHHTVV